MRRKNAQKMAELFQNLATGIGSVAIPLVIASAVFAVDQAVNEAFTAYDVWAERNIVEPFQSVSERWLCERSETYCSKG